MIPKKQFENWLRHQLFVDLDGGRCCKLILKHVTSASKAGQNILNIEVPIEVNNDWIADQSLMIEETAAADAGGSGGSQQYVVMAFHEESPEKSSARFNIRMQGEADPDDGDLSSEPATTKGLLAQTMRHMEAIMRTSSLSQATTMQMLQRTAAQQGAIIEKLVEEKFGNIATIESMLSQKNERDIEMMKAHKSQELKEKALGTLQMIAPTVLNKLLTSGSPAGVAAPQAVAARDQQLMALGDSMTPEQLMKLQQVFNQEQLMMFVDVFTQIKQQQEIAEAEKNNK